MIKFELTGAMPVFDAPAYIRALDFAISDQMVESSRAFLRAALVRVPVDSGMSRGSFLNLGRVINQAVPIRPRRTGLTYYGPPRLPKTPASGALLSSKEEDLFVSDGRTHSFNFSSLVKQFLLHDPTWGATQAGLSAFIADFNKNLPSKIPPISKFIKTAKLA